MMILVLMMMTGKDDVGCNTNEDFDNNVDGIGHDCINSAIITPDTIIKWIHCCGNYSELSQSLSHFILTTVPGNRYYSFIYLMSTSGTEDLRRVS